MVQKYLLPPDLFCQTALLVIFMSSDQCIQYCQSADLVKDTVLCIVSSVQLRKTDHCNKRKTKNTSVCIFNTSYRTNPKQQEGFLFFSLIFVSAFFFRLRVKVHFRFPSEPHISATVPRGFTLYTCFSVSFWTQ